MRKIVMLILIICFCGIVGCAAKKGHWHEIVVNNATGNFISYRITNESGFDVTATDSMRIFIPEYKFKIERFCSNWNDASELHVYDRESTITVNFNNYCGTEQVFE